MKINLVVTDAKGKNLAFVSDDGKTFSQKEAVVLVREGEVPHAHVVRRNGVEYVRANRNVPESEGFDKHSISLGKLLSFAQDTRHALSTPALTLYLDTYEQSVTGNKPFIAPVGQRKVLMERVRERIVANGDLIRAASKRFSIDTYLLAAILIDEVARLNPFEDIIDVVGVAGLGRNMSIGIAQVKTDTANDLIRRGVYNPNPNDPVLLFKRMDAAARVHLYAYLVQPLHSISFAAALLGVFVNEWRAFSDLTLHSSILTTLYHLSYKKPHANPQSDERGEQIAGEFYQLAKQWLL